MKPFTKEAMEESHQVVTSYNNGLLDYHHLEVALNYLGTEHIYDIDESTGKVVQTVFFDYEVR